MPKKPMPGTVSNAPNRYGPGSKKSIEMQASKVEGGGRMTSATKKRNTTMTKNARTAAAGEMRAKNIEGHDAMTKKAKAALEYRTTARRPKGD